MLNHKADPNLRSPQGRTPLFGAVTGDKAELVELLLNRGADPAAQDQQGMTALHRAAVGPVGRAVSLLASRTNLPELKTAAGDTPLSPAIRHGQAKTAELLLQAGANPNVWSGYPSGCPRQRCAGPFG